MPNAASFLNSIFRKLAQTLSPRNPVRQRLSKAWTRVLDRFGATVEVPIGDRTIELLTPFRHFDPSYEAETLKLWFRLVSPSLTIYDIGANIGLYSVLTAKQLDRGKVICFEPAPVSFETTKKHLEINGASDKCHVIQAAVSKESGGVIRFSILEDAQGTNPMNRIAKKEETSTVDVPVMCLDQILKEYGEPDLIKMDIEGAEVDALRGASDLLSRVRPIVLLAVHPMFLPEFGYEPSDLMAILQEHRYVAMKIDGEVVTELLYDEYLLVPSERAEQVRQDVFAS